VAARRRFLASLCAVADAFSPRVTVVFDSSEPLHDEFDSTAVELVLPAAGLNADFTIERMVAAHPSPSGVLVVTSDRQIRDAVEASGADSISCSGFMEEIEEKQKEVAGSVGKNNALRFKPRMGDVFPGKL